MGPQQIIKIQRLANSLDGRIPNQPNSIEQYSKLLRQNSVKNSKASSLLNLIQTEIEKEHKESIQKKLKQNSKSEVKILNQKKILKRNLRIEEKIDFQKTDYAASVKLCKEMIASYKRTKDKRKWDKAREIYYNDLIGVPKSYEDIQRPEMRLKYLELLDKGEIFPQDKEILNRYEKANDYHSQTKYRPQILSYKDLIAMYVNILEKDIDPSVYDDFNELTTAICGIRKIQGSMNRNQHLLQRDKKIVFVHPVDPSDTTLDAKKKRLKESIDAKRRSNMEHKLKSRTTVPVDDTFQ